MAESKLVTDEGELGILGTEVHAALKSASASAHFTRADDEGARRVTPCFPALLFPGLGRSARVLFHRAEDSHP
jgi:hypothetical protein